MYPLPEIYFSQTEPRKEVQTAMIRTHLEQGRTITPQDALRLYGSMRLAARVNELRKSGMAIQTKIINSGSRRFAQYSLIKN